MVWIVRLVEAQADGEERCADVMKINRPDDLHDIASLGLTLAEAKLLLGSLQREIVAAQAKSHAVCRPNCSGCGGVCRVKDDRKRVIATLFGRVTVRLPRFCCATCGRIQPGTGWPLQCRSTPELDRLQAHLSALMTYRTAAEVLEQMFPVDAGKDAETLRRRTLKIGEVLRNNAVAKPETTAPSITVTLDSTFIRSCEDGGRHLEVRVSVVHGSEVETQQPLSRLGSGNADIARASKLQHAVEDVNGDIDFRCPTFVHT